MKQSTLAWILFVLGLLLSAYITHFHPSPLRSISHIFSNVLEAGETLDTEVASWCTTAMESIFLNLSNAWTPISERAEISRQACAKAGVMPQVSLLLKIKGKRLHLCPSKWFNSGEGQKHRNPIWQAIEKDFINTNGHQNWGSFLDAGTGSGSLRWLLTLNTTEWTAITASSSMHNTVVSSFGHLMRENDKLLLMNWEDSSPLQGQVFDIVLADYLLGAMDGFSPYYQDKLFDWLRPFVGQRLYFVGKEPMPDQAIGLNASKTTGGDLVLEVERLRDSCLLLSGARMYREYPIEWVKRHLNKSGFVVEGEWSFPIRYVANAMELQLQTCTRRLHKIQDVNMRNAMADAVTALTNRLYADPEVRAGICFGMDYVIAASPKTTGT